MRKVIFDKNKCDSLLFCFVLCFCKVGVIKRNVKEFFNVEIDID